MTVEEQRVHVRVLAMLPCSLSLTSGEHTGVVLDISRGGARLELPKNVCEVGEVFALAITVPNVGDPIRMTAEVLRIEPREHGDCMGVRFASIDPKLSKTLTNYIESIDNTAGGEARRHPRLMRHLEVTLTTIAQFRAVMRDVSKGGMGLLCDVPVVLDEAIKVDVQVPKLPRLVLPGRVAHVRSASAGNYRVGVKFDDLSPETKDLLKAFLKSLGPDHDEQDDD